MNRALVPIIALSACGGGPEFVEPLTTSVPITGTQSTEMFGSIVIGLEIDDRPGLELAITSPTYRPEGALSDSGRLTLVTFDGRTPRVLQQIDGEPGVVALGLNGVTTADIDGDGTRELLATATGMMGNGVMAFPIQPRGVIDTSAPKFFVVTYGGKPTGLGDINGDGFDDLLALGMTMTNSIFIGSSTGLATMPLWQKVVMGSGPFASATGDLDEDGDLDIVIGQRNRQATLNGALVFVFGPLPPEELEVLGGPAEGLGGDVGLGDVDGDGALDIAVAAGGVDTVYVYHGPFGRDPAAIVPAEPLYGPVGFGDRLVVADPDGDGDSDVIVGSPLYSDAGFMNEGAISLYTGGRRSLGARRDISPIDVAGAQFGSFLAAGDVDGDGVDDVAVTQGGNVRVLFGECGGAGRCVDENQTRYLACSAGGEPVRGTPILLAVFVALRRRRRLASSRRQARGGDGEVDGARDQSGRSGDPAN